MGLLVHIKPLSANQPQLRVKTMNQPCSIETCRRLIAEQLPSRYPTIEYTACQLHISVRTLQRRLRARGFVYEDLVDGVRREVASRLLQELDTSIADVARAAAYTDPSSFSRAFRRWKGMSPQAYRQRLGLQANTRR